LCLVCSYCNPIHFLPRVQSWKFLIYFCLFFSSQIWLKKLGCLLELFLDDDIPLCLLHFCRIGWTFARLLVPRQSSQVRITPISHHAGQYSVIPDQNSLYCWFCPKYSIAILHREIWIFDNFFCHKASTIYYLFSWMGEPIGYLYPENISCVKITCFLRSLFLGLL
jgi:hypothetical protein